MAEVYVDYYKDLLVNELFTKADVALQNIKTDAIKKYCDFKIKSIRKKSNATKSEYETAFSDFYDSQPETIKTALEELQQKADSIKDDVGELEQEVEKLSKKVSEKFEELARQTQEKMQRAQNYLEEYSSIIQRINKLNPEKFHSDKYSYYALLDNYRNAEENFNIADYEACIALSQKNITNANRLMLWLVLKNEEFQKAVDEARKALEDVNKLFENYSSMDLDIDYWSKGIFETLQNSFSHTCEYVEKAIDNFDINQLKKFKAVICSFESDLQECYQYSLFEKNRSDIVLQAAKTAFETIETDNNYIFEQGGFVDEDKRKAHRATYTNGAGTVVEVLVCSPDKNVVSPTTEIIVEAKEAPENNQNVENAIVEAFIKKGLKVSSDYNNANPGEISKLDAAFLNSEDSFLQRRTMVVGKIDNRKEELLKNAD